VKGEKYEKMKDGDMVVSLAEIWQRKAENDEGNRGLLKIFP
jgi:hypothetical protein